VSKQRRQERDERGDATGEQRASSEGPASVVSLIGMNTSGDYLVFYECFNITARLVLRVSSF
jgi:hypothetical protein